MGDTLELLEGLRARFSAPYAPPDKHLIERLYQDIFGRMFVPTSCQNCYHDAVIEMYLYLKNGNTMAKDKNYILKCGAIICNPKIDNGKVYSNANLTDEVASAFLAMFPEKANLFEKYVKPAQKRAVTDEKSAGGTTTHKTAKTPSKRK